MLQITDEELIKYIKLCEVQLNTFVKLFSMFR